MVLSAQMHCPINSSRYRRSWEYVAHIWNEVTNHVRTVNIHSDVLRSDYGGGIAE